MINNMNTIFKKCIKTNYNLLILIICKSINNFFIIQQMLSLFFHLILDFLHLLDYLMHLRQDLRF